MFCHSESELKTSLCLVSTFLDCFLLPLVLTKMLQQANWTGFQNWAVKVCFIYAAQGEIFFFF